MKSSKFKEVNRIFPKSDQSCTLFIYTDKQQCISKWKLSILERLQVLIFGYIWLGIGSGSKQPPVWLSSKRKVVEEKDIYLKVFQEHQEWEDFIIETKEIDSLLLDLDQLYSDKLDSGLFKPIILRYKGIENQYLLFEPISKNNTYQVHKDDLCRLNITGRTFYKARLKE